MTKQEEIEALRNDPEVLAGIREGLQDAHLGHVFSHRLVFGALKGIGGVFYKRWYFRTIINLKELWWWLKTPYQKFAHRNCPKCKEYRS